jgi:hypothetical protein
MSVSGISASSFFSQNPANIQNQQRMRQEFQSLAQEFQSGNLSATQSNVAALEQGLQTGASTSAESSSPGASSGSQNTHLHHHHHMRFRVDAGSDNSATSLFNELGQTANPSGAQAAYSSLQQDLQQVALNSDLMNAQAAALQASSGISLTV